MTDRRPINKNVVVPKPGGGTQPRSRNNDGQIRDKRSDAKKPNSRQKAHPTGPAHFIPGDLRSVSEPLSSPTMDRTTHVG
jgi:hypothetical protein